MQQLQSIIITCPKNCFVAWERALHVKPKMITYPAVQFPMMFPQNLDVHTVYLSRWQEPAPGCFRPTPSFTLW